MPHPPASQEAGFFRSPSAVPPKLDPKPRWQ